MLQLIKIIGSPKKMQSEDNRTGLKVYYLFRQGHPGTFAYVQPGTLFLTNIKVVGRTLSRLLFCLITAQIFSYKVIVFCTRSAGTSRSNLGSAETGRGRFQSDIVRWPNVICSFSRKITQSWKHSKCYSLAAFDNTCDLSAVLGILERASLFHPSIQTNAKDVRSKVRNEWGHCNFDHWTKLEFHNSFQLMETMIRSLRLTKRDEDKELDELHDWETKGKCWLLQYLVSSWLLRIRIDASVNSLDLTYWLMHFQVL